MTSSPTELTTALTDVLLAVACSMGLIRLQRLPVQDEWKRSTWTSVLALVALGTAVGAMTHGFEWPSTARLLLRGSLFPILGLAVSMFVVGAIGDWRGRDAVRASRPWAIVAGVSTVAVPLAFNSSFALFAVFEGAGMIAAFAIYSALWRAGRPGAGLIAAGIALTLLAAVVQRSSVHATIVWAFDHNGLFHLIQLIAIVVAATGIRINLTSPRT